MESKINLVPAQRTGEESNTEKNIECESREEADLLFHQAEQRLFDVNHWHQYAGLMTAEFRLCDREGNEVDRMVVPGDHFKIDIPGPGSGTGDGFDWVKVEDVARTAGQNEATSQVRVRPATSPVNNDPAVAHFFDEHSTSTFMVKRNGNKVTAGVYGRNEKPNTAVGDILDKARNTAVAAVAVSFYSKYQWKSLVEGFLNNKPEK